jgi:hypothetical protein
MRGSNGIIYGGISQFARKPTVHANIITMIKDEVSRRTNGEVRNTCQILGLKPIGKGPLGRPKRRWILKT